MMILLSSNLTSGTAECRKELLPMNRLWEESPYLPVDGELPWGTWSMNEDPDNPEAGWIIDGLQTARRLFLQHYTSLSAIHNYKEKGTKDKYSMMYWKETPVTEEFLKENQMPISDGYFRKKGWDEGGTERF